MNAVPVATMVENGNFYVVMAKTSPDRVPGRDLDIKRTTLTVSRLSTALGIAVLEEGEQLHSKDVFTRYAALPPTGGLFWEYAGRRLLDECVKLRPLTQSQLQGYGERYDERCADGAVTGHTPVTVTGCDGGDHG